MADAGFRRDVETKLASFKQTVHDSSLLLAAAATLPLAIITVYLIALAEDLHLNCPSYLIVLVFCSIILFNFAYALNRTTETDADNGNRVYPNLYTIVKATGCVFVIAFFAALDSALKDVDKLIAITLCLSFYFYLLISMILFKVSEDFDLAGTFLTTCFSMFYAKSEGIEILGLVVASMLLGSLKSYLVGSKNKIVVVPSPVVAIGLKEINEKRLATLRTVIRNSNVGLISAISITLFVFGVSVYNLCLEHQFSWDSMTSLCFLICLYAFFHFIYGRNRSGDTHQVRDQIRYFNLYCLMKGIGAQFIVFVFTVLDNWLKGIDRLNAISMCLSVYIYLVLAMVFFKISEDCDLAGAFLSAAFTLFYEKSEGIGTFTTLMFTSIILASIKSFLISGENLEEPPDRLPQLRLSGRRSQSL